MSILRLPNLHYLDISANKLVATDLVNLLGQIHLKNQIRTLNIGYNSSACQKVSQDDEADPFA